MAKPDTDEPLENSGTVNDVPKPGILDDGFNLIARDLDRAFALGLSTNQAAIMNHIREQSWTASLVVRRKGEPRPEPIPAQVNITHLATATGLNRSRLSLALKSLVTATILTPLGAYFLINKDYSHWLDDAGKGPRFSLKQLGYIRAGKAIRGGTGISENGTLLLLPSATVSPNGAIADCNSYCCEAQQLHIEERAPEDLREILEIELPPPPPANVPPSVSQQQQPETDAPPDPENPPVTDLTEFIGFVYERFGEKIGDVVRSNARSVEMNFVGRYEFYLAALARAKTYAKPIRDLHGFCLRVGTGYIHTGIPPAPFALDPESEVTTPPLSAPKLTPSQERDRHWAEASKRSAAKIRDLDI